MGCADPCCDGVPARIDCGENPTLSCTEKGDPCTAQQYGCTNGLFFSMSPSSLPASCNQRDAGADARSPGGADGAVADTGVDAPAVVDSGGLFACGDATCASGSQYCKETSGGAPPGIDTQTCEPLPDGQSLCEPEAASSGCSCSEDAGATYVSCQVP